VHAFHRDGVGAGNQEEVRIGLRVGGGLHPVHHLALRHDLLAGPVPAALGSHLVLDMAGGGPGLDQRLDGALDVERAGAKAGIDVHQQRQVTHVGDAAGVDEHILERVDAQVRHAQRAGRDAAAREVDRTEAGALGQQGVVGVDGADHLQRGLFGEGGAETRAGGGTGHLGLLRIRVAAPGLVAPAADGRLSPIDLLINLDPLDQYAAMDDAFLPATRACELLGISPATLYAYVSRGLVQSRPGPDHRSRLYRRSDIDKLLQRKRAGRGAARGAAQSLDRGLPAMETRSSQIRPDGPWYRGRSAVALARDGASLEDTARLLWDCGDEDPFAHPLGEGWPATVRAVAGDPDLPPLERAMAAIPLLALEVRHSF